MKILLAEDERELNDALVVILKHNNYSVDPVYNGQDAYDYLMADEYDGAILDIMMPKMDGLTVLRKIREEGNHVPVLILTARSQVDDLVEGLDTGADDYLSKPFVTKELLARLRSVTRRKAEQIHLDLSCGNLTLDNVKYEISTPSGSIRLPNKEYQMMEIFLTNPGQIISAERLLEKIWGYETDTDIRTVWVYISYLRKKLAKLHADVEIKAARNQGYLIERK